MEDYIKIGEHVFARLDNSSRWVHSNGKQIDVINYLEVCRRLANLWIQRKDDKYALKRYEQGEFGFGGFPYNMAKGMKYRYHKLTNLILQF